MQSLQLPIAPDEFRTKFFEKNMAYFKRSISSIPYTWDDFTRDFFTIDPADRRVRVFNGGELHKERYSFLVQDGPSVRCFYRTKVLQEQLKTGATLVVNNFERTCEYVSTICNHFAELTGNRCAGNAYVTSGGAGTFGKHWDTHCVFVTQILGRKLWRVYRPTQELPLQFQTSKDVKHECGDIPIFEKIMEPGDILYIPRGWWHEAIPLANTPTLHIAAGIYTTKIFEYLRWIVEARMPQVYEARESIGEEMDDALFLTIAKVFEEQLLLTSNKEAFIKKHVRITQKQVPVNFNAIFHT